VDDCGSTTVLWVVEPVQAGERALHCPTLGGRPGVVFSCLCRIRIFTPRSQTGRRVRVLVVAWSRITSTRCRGQPRLPRPRVSMLFHGGCARRMTGLRAGQLSHNRLSRAGSVTESTRSRAVDWVCAEDLTWPVPDRALRHQAGCHGTPVTISEVTSWRYQRPCARAIPNHECRGDKNFRKPRMPS
jgi:hypothetical protein